MKRYLLSVAAIISLFLLASWGYKGHRMTALVAEDYLTPQAKEAVKGFRKMS